MRKLTILFSVVLTLTSYLALALPAKADPENQTLGVTGIIAGVPIGIINGLHRGPITKTRELGESFSDALGANTASKIGGYALALLPGVIGGLIGGIAKGAIKGVKYGYEAPFSPESFNMDGPYMDYDA